MGAKLAYSIVGVVVLIWIAAEIAFLFNPAHPVDPALNTAVTAIIGGAAMLAFNQTRRNGNGNGNGNGEH